MDIIEKILEINCSINKYDFKDDNDVIGIIVNKNDTDMFNGEGYAFLIDKRLNESDSKLVCAMLYKKLIINNLYNFPEYRLLNETLLKYNNNFQFLLCYNSYRL